MYLDVFNELKHLLLVGDLVLIDALVHDVEGLDVLVDGLGVLLKLQQLGAFGLECRLHLYYTSY